jgi:hypothetical protein
LPVVDEAPLQGPLAFSPGLVLVEGSRAVPVPMPVVPLDVVLPGDVLPGVDMPGDVGLPVEGLPTAPAPADPAAPPLAPPAPPAPAANAEPEDRANASASIVVVIFMTFSIGVTKDKKPGDVAFLADVKSRGPLLVTFWTGM